MSPSFCRYVFLCSYIFIYFLYFFIVPIRKVHIIKNNYYKYNIIANKFHGIKITDGQKVSMCYDKSMRRNKKLNSYEAFFMFHKSRSFYRCCYMLYSTGLGNLYTEEERNCTTLNLYCMYC